MFFKIKKYMFYYLRNTNEMECKQLSGWQSTLSTFSDFCLLGRPNSQLGRLATKVVTNGLRNGFEFSQEKSCLGQGNEPAICKGGAQSKGEKWTQPTSFEKHTEGGWGDWWGVKRREERK